MDERLEKALDFSNFMVTLNNQRKLIYEKFLDVINLIDIILHDTTLTTEIIWAMDLDSTESLNILDVTKLVHFILFH